MRFALIAISFLLSPIFASAHATGVSYEEHKDGYKIDIGHESTIVADTATRFDFAIYPENSTSTDNVYTDVWVTLTKDKQIIFAGGISKPVFGSTGFMTVFPHEGAYTVSARFQKNGDSVVKTEFPITVNPLPVASKSNIDFQVVVSIIGLLIALCLGYFLGYKRKNK